MKKRFSEPLHVSATADEFGELAAVLFALGQQIRLSGNDRLADIVSQLENGARHAEGHVHQREYAIAQGRLVWDVHLGDPLLIDDARRGDRVRLDWKGYTGVARWMSGSWATVVDVKNTRIVVRADTENYDAPAPSGRTIILDEVDMVRRPHPLPTDRVQGA